MRTDTVSSAAAELVPAAEHSAVSAASCLQLRDIFAKCKTLNFKFVCM